MNKDKKVFITNGFEETQRLGEKFVEKITRLHLDKGSPLTVCLSGDLGSGKTTFVQGFAKGLGIKRRIISPTFTIIRRYKMGIRNQESGIRNFHHIDLYRIDDEKSIKGLGIEEIIKDPQNIVAIEWAEKLGDLLPKKRWDVRLEYVGEDKRRITIKIGLWK